jgi:hypothetical protein
MILATGGSRGDYTASTAGIDLFIVPADKWGACQILRISAKLRFTTTATYIERVNLAIDHVVNHLDEPLRLRHSTSTECSRPLSERRRPSS